MSIPKKIHVNSSSLIDLKAELFRKQEALKAEKLRRELGQFSKDSTAGFKEKKANAEKKQNAGVQERARRDVQEVVADEEETDMLKKSRDMLEKKTKIYDTLTKGEVLPNDDIKELYLVDFERKILHDQKEQLLDENKRKEADLEEVLLPSGPEEEWVDYVDALGRSRRCMKKDLPELQEMDKELQNCRNSTSEDRKDEENSLSTNDHYKSEEPVVTPDGPIHYQNVRHKEIRTHGVGYFSFSTDEEQRKIQIESLKNLRDQTVEQRAARERLKEKRKVVLKARLTKVKRRKGIEVESEDSNESSSDKDIEEKKDIPTEDEPKKETKTRPWDIGKVLPPAHRKPQFTREHWIQKKREERLQEFAPPQVYNLDAATFGNSFQPTTDNQNLQDDVERIIAETLTYYKNKTS